MRTAEQRRNYRRNKYATDTEYREKQLAYTKKLYVENPKYKEQHAVNHRKFSEINKLAFQYLSGTIKQL